MSMNGGQVDKKNIDTTIPIETPVAAGVDGRLIKIEPYGELWCFMQAPQPEP